MKKSRFTETQIISILKQADAGVPVKDICRQAGISIPTYYQWKSKYGGLEASELRRVKELESENAKLKRMYVVRTALERRTRLAQHQDNLGTGSPRWQDTIDDRKAVVRRAACVQPYPAADASLRQTGECVAAPTELQTQHATVAGMEPARAASRRNAHRTLAGPDCRAPRRSQARTHRAAGRQTKTQTVATAHSITRQSARENTTVWAPEEA